jgi:hypothetical protein
VIPLGRAIATEFASARWLLSRAEEQARRVTSIVRQGARPDG